MALKVRESMVLLLIGWPKAAVQQRHRITPENNLSTGIEFGYKIKENGA
jgi:hypothetical protein